MLALLKTSFINKESWILDDQELPGDYQKDAWDEHEANAELLPGHETSEKCKTGLRKRAASDQNYKNALVMIMQ